MNNQASQKAIVAGMMAQHQSFDYMRGNASNLLAGQITEAA